MEHRIWVLSQDVPGYPAHQFKERPGSARHSRTERHDDFGTFAREIWQVSTDISPSHRVSISGT